MGFQKAKRDLKAVYDHSNSEYSDNERRKTLYVMFGGSWDITSHRIVKNQCREVAVAAHHRWMQTSISFDTSDCPKSMVGARQLPLLVSLTIGNIKLYYILIGGGAALNLISLVAFKKLQIPMLKLQLSRPFSKVGPVPVIQCGYISLPVTFGTPENFLTESVLFDIAEVSLPFNAILGRPTLYQFMVVAHYGCIVLKMPSPNGILKILKYHKADVSALEKLHAMATQHEVVAVPGTFELTPVWLIISTPRAALQQRGRPCEDCSDQGGCYPDHPHRRGSRQ
jgi:hypothetical protein